MPRWLRHTSTVLRSTVLSWSNHFFNKKWFGRSTQKVWPLRVASQLLVARVASNRLMLSRPCRHLHALSTVSKRSSLPKLLICVAQLISIASLFLQRR